MTTPTEPLTRRGIPMERDLRILALGQFANRFGGGAVMTTSALYFTRMVGLSATDVGLAMSVAAMVGILVQVPAGQLADTRGPRRVLVIAMTGAALTSILPALAGTVWTLAGALALLAVFERSVSAVQQGIVAQIATGGRGVLFRAYLRAVTNVAIALGSLFGGAALIVDARWAYLSVFVLNALVTGFAAWNATRLPDLPAYERAQGEPRLAVLRDWPFVVVTALTGLFALHFFVMELGVALFISERTEAPTVMVAVLLLLNTVMVALFQVRLSRSATSIETSARALWRGGVWIAVGFGVIGLAGHGSAWQAVALLLLGSVVHVVGEMIGSGGQWGLQMGLAPHERQGQYQGFAGMGFAVVSVIGPPVVTYFCVDQGERGWFMLGGIMLAISAVTIPVSRWALASRAQYGVTTHSG